MLKNMIRRMAQQILGFDRYLFVFSVVNIFRIKTLKTEEAFRFFMRLIPPEGAILDIGANIGINTVILAQQFPRSVIHAFEPVKENFRALEKVTAYYRLNNLRLYQTALGETAGEAEMITPRHKGARMQGWSRMAEMDETPGEKCIVPVQPLDLLEDIKNEKITAIKIDVENFEYYVLKGAEQIIRKNKPVIFCELWNDERRIWCLDLLAGMGYDVMIYQNRQLVPYSGEDALDYFFIPQTQR